MQHGINHKIDSPHEVMLKRVERIPQNSIKLFVSNTADRPSYLGETQHTRLDDTMKVWDWVKTRRKNCQFLICTDLPHKSQTARAESIWGKPHCINTREYSYSTGSSLWFTNINLPDGWDIRSSRNRMNPDNCLIYGCYIMPNQYNGKTYVGPHSTVVGETWQDEGPIFL